MGAKERRSLREGLLGGMSKRELDQVKQYARDRMTSYSSFEDRMVDAVCFTSMTLGQYWPPTEDRELDMQTTMALHRSVGTAKAEDAKLRRQEAEFLMDAYLHHPGHSRW